MYVCVFLLTIMNDTRDPMNCTAIMKLLMYYENLTDTFDS